MKDRYSATQTFCYAVNRLAKIAGLNQQQLAEVFGLDRFTFNRKLHNERGLGFGLLDNPRELVQLIMFFVNVGVMTGDDELNTFIALIPSCFASPKGRAWIRSSVKTEVEKQGIFWKIPADVSREDNPLLSIKKTFPKDYVLMSLDTLNKLYSIVDDLIEEQTLAAQRAQERFRLLQIETRAKNALMQNTAPIQSIPKKSIDTAPLKTPQLQEENALMQNTAPIQSIPKKSIDIDTAPLKTPQLQEEKPTDC